MIEREDLVLLHGFAGTSRTWEGVLAHLSAERYRPLVLDLPGHGSQAGAAGPIDFDAVVDSVLRRSPPRFALCGYSLGGRVALHVALAAPELIECLVIAAASPGIEDAGERAARRVADDRLAREIEAGTIDDFIVRWCAQPMFAHDPPTVDALARADYARNRPDTLATALRGVGQGEMEPVWARLAELSMPVTVLVGERDAKYRQIAARMVESLPEGRLAIVPGGHRLPLESPRQVAEELEELSVDGKEHPS